MYGVIHSFVLPPSFPPSLLAPFSPLPPCPLLSFTGIEFRASYMLSKQEPMLHTPAIIFTSSFQMSN